MARWGKGRSVAAAVAVSVTLSLAQLVTVPVGAAGRASGARPAVRIVEQRAPHAVERNATFTTGASITPTPANPFDPAQAMVRVRFRSPGGRVVVADAYWFQDFTRALANGREVLTPSGAPFWKVRFTPTERGVWTWRWDATTTAGTTTGRWHLLVVRSRAAGHGFLRVSPRDARYLAYDDGTPYFAIGENVSCADRRGTYAYDHVLDELASQGATWIRVWMAACGLDIETSDTGLGDYTNRLDRAWQLDHVLDAAAARGIAVQLVLLYHGDLSTRINPTWDGNPYNAANGGPIATPAEFFTDPTAEDLFRRRLRYVVARFGADTNLLAWELWNEVDLTDDYDSTSVAAWHRAMADYIRSIDPARHPITTSFAYFFNDPAVIEGADLDLVQQHFYSRTELVPLFPDLAQVVVDLPRARVAEYSRPTLIGELGVGSGPDDTLALDPEGIAVHDGLWAAPFGEAMGTGMPWWWRLVIDAEPNRYYPMFGSIASYLAGVPWDREHFAVVDPAVTTASGRAVRAHALVGTGQALLWVKDGDVRYYRPDRVMVTDAQVALDGLSGTWCAGWWDTWSGAWYRLARFTGGPGRNLAMPPFAADTALRMFRC